MSHVAADNATDALLDRLIDDASVFPPAKLETAAALRAHYRHRESAYHALQGRFVIPASRLAEVRALRDPAEPLTLSVILDGGDVSADLAEAARTREGGNTVDSLELRGTPAAIDLEPFAAFASDQPLTVWLEAPFDGGWAAAPSQTLEALAALGAGAPPNLRLGAKVRCGGLSASAFPSVADLADFIVAAKAAGVPWKATAGLHHPVRHVQAQTGFMMHGFLNLAVAALAHHAGRADAAAVHAILAEEDPAAFTVDPLHVAWRGVRVDAAEVAAGRRAALCSYGSCSFAEPVNDLRELGILA